MIKNNYLVEEFLLPALINNFSIYLQESDENIVVTAKIAEKIIVDKINHYNNDGDIIGIMLSEASKIALMYKTVLFNFSKNQSSISFNNFTLGFYDALFASDKAETIQLLASKAAVSEKSVEALLKLTSILVLAYIIENEVTKSNLADHLKLVYNAKQAQTTKKNSLKTKQPPLEQVESEPTAAPIKSSKSKIIFLVAAIFAIAAVAFFMLKFKNGNSSGTNANATKTIKVAAASAQEITSTNILQLGNIIDFTLPSQDIITIPEKGVEKALLDLLLDQSKTADNLNYWLILDRITFEKRNENYKVDSEEQLKNISLIMHSFPKLKLAIGCYTDNVGDENQNVDLSTKRAASIKAGLMTFGIVDNKLKPQGFGSGYAIADNKTDASRAMNRRVCIKIIEK